MKKILFLAFLLSFAACKKDSTPPTPVAPPPDITENLSLSIVNQNPDKYDSAMGHVSDIFSWSIPNAYGDTSVTTGGGVALPPNATTLIVQCTDNATYAGDTWLSVNNGTDFSKVGLTIDFPADTSYLKVERFQI